MTTHSQNDAFHEIQLNGKQLVFLFMAATVVSVVIFLCGVLVGRGVRVERGSSVENAALTDPTPAELAVTASPRLSSQPSDPPAARGRLHAIAMHPLSPVWCPRAARDEIHRSAAPAFSRSGVFFGVQRSAADVMRLRASPRPT